MGEKEFLKLYMKERGLKNLEEAKEKVNIFGKLWKSLLKREKVKFKDWGNFEMKDVRPRRIIELKTKRHDNPWKQKNEIQFWKRSYKIYKQ